jgi:drug/metabolite transporter (DMT)-like permease
VAGNAGYYLLLVVGIRTAGAPLTDMVIGAIPVVVAVAGNALAPAGGPSGGRMPWRRLALPLTLVTAGLALVSALELAGVHAFLAVSPAEKAAGLLAAAGAVVLWTWYALANARFLARHDAVSPGGWSTAVGVAARLEWPAAGQLAGLLLVLAGVTLTLLAVRPGRLAS